LRHPHLALLGLVLLLGTRAGAAEPTNDPLPEGAKLRLGSDRLVYRYGPHGLVLGPDCKTFLTPDRTSKFLRLDAVTGRPLDATKSDWKAGGVAVFSGDGQRAVTTNEGVLTVSATDTEKTIRELKLPPELKIFNPWGEVSLSVDGKVIAHATKAQKDGRVEVCVWDVEAGKIIASFETVHKDGVAPVLSPDGKRLAARDSMARPFSPPGSKEDQTRHLIQIWDVGTKSELFQFRVSPGGQSITSCQFSPDGTFFAASRGAGPVDLWSVKTGKPVATLLGRTDQGLHIAFSPDSKTLAAVAADGAIQRWATADGKDLGTTEPPGRIPISAAMGLGFADNTRAVAWGVVGSSVAVWEAPSGKFLRPPSPHTLGITGIGFADGGKRIFTAGLDSSLAKWDGVTGSLIGPVAIRPSRTNTIERFNISPVLNLAPDATRGITFTLGPAVYDLETGAELFALPPNPPTEPGTTLATADVRRTVTLRAPPPERKGGPSTVIVWDLAARKKVAELELPIDYSVPPTAAFSPSGDRLVIARSARAAGAEQTVLMVTGFDLKTGKKFADYEDHTATGAMFLAVASESMAVVVSGTGRMRLVDYETGRGGEDIETGVRRERTGAIVFSPDGKRFALGVGLDDWGPYGVKVYEWPSAKPLRTFLGHRSEVSALAFSPDSKTLASGSHDTTVLLWDLTTIDKPK
jgi:WD40 repeat protein